MTKLIFIFLFSVLSSTTYAQCSTSTTGSINYTDCADGRSFFSQQIGDTTYHSGDISGTSSRIGNTTYHDGDVNGTSTQIGNTMYHDGDVDGTSTRIGNTTYHDLDSGSYACTQIGSSTFCD